MATHENQLVNGDKLLEILFDKHCRPSRQWLIKQRNDGVIPCVRVGRLIFYDPAKVREKLFPPAV